MCAFVCLIVGVFDWLFFGRLIDCPFVFCSRVCLIECMCVCLFVCLLVCLCVTEVVRLFSRSFCYLCYCIYILIVLLLVRSMVFYFVVLLVCAIA